MSIFPPLTDGYIGDRKGLLGRMEDTYSKYTTINQSFWSEADTDMRFLVGDQTMYNDVYGNVPSFRRRQFTFNRLRRIINMVTGYQRQHRKSMIGVPEENSDQDTADQLTKCLLWACNRNGVLETISQAFEGAMITGMNLLSVWMDYRSDPANGDIVVDNLGYNGFLIDPYFRKHDLSDCNSIWTRKFVSKQMAKQLLPGREDEIDGMVGYGQRDGKFQFVPEAYNYGAQDLLTYDEFWYLDSRLQKVLFDPTTGGTKEFSGNPEDLQYFLRMFPHVEVIENLIPTVRLGVVLQGRVMYDGPNPLGIDSYPFIPVLGYYQPNVPYYPWRCQGMVRGLRDAQFLYNRRKIIELDILESQVNSGWKFKENALVNPNDLFQTGQGRILALKESAQMTDVEQVLAPNIPPAVMELSKILGDELQQISGVNEELLGAADDDKAGILSMLRQGAGLTTLQISFDQLDYSQKMLGKVMMSLMQANWTPGKVQRILGEEPTEEFYDRAFGKYDVVIEDGLNTPTQRNMQFQQLMAMRQAEIPIPVDLLIQTSNLQNKKELVEAIRMQQESEKKTAQEGQQGQMALLQAQIQDIHSRAKANEGMALERVSRVAENESLAIERRAQAVYDEVKAMKELQHLDIDAIQKMVDILAALKGTQDQEEAALRPEASKAASE